MGIQHFALQLGSSPATGPSCSQEHLRNCAKNSLTLNSADTAPNRKDGKKTVWFPFLFTSGISEKRYLSRGSHCLGWLTGFWLETTLTTARLPQSQLCIWFRCRYCPKGWGLSCHGWDPAAQGDGSARVPQALGHPHQQHRGHCCHHLTRLS